MPMDRLDLNTGTWIRQRRNRWSNEEIQAYIDHHHQLDQEAEVEEELRGPFGTCKDIRAKGIAQI